MKKDYILFIDSGIGGLTTLCKCYKQLNSNYLYFADNNNSPYGNHSKKEIYVYLKNIIDSLLLKYQIKIIVIACNTATTSAIDKLRSTFSNIVFIGTEPALKLANKLGFKKIFCAVTPATLKQNKFKLLTNSINSKTRLYASKTLATNIENYFTKKSLSSLYNLTKEIYSLANLGKNYDCFVLGCTHYVFIKKQIQQLSNKVSIDGNLGVSKQLQANYNKLGLKNNDKSSIKFFVSNDKLTSQEIYKKIFQEILAKV